MAEAASKPAILTEVREKNSSRTHGPDRHAMLKKLLQADHTITIEGWINSPGLQPPK
jgi:hypothetical protein